MKNCLWLSYEIETWSPKNECIMNAPDYGNFRCQLICKLKSSWIWLHWRHQRWPRHVPWWLWNSSTCLFCLLWLYVWRVRFCCLSKSLLLHRFVCWWDHRIRRQPRWVRTRSYNGADHHCGGYHKGYRWEDGLGSGQFAAFIGKRKEDHF